MLAALTKALFPKLCRYSVSNPNRRHNATFSDARKIAVDQ